MGPVVIVYAGFGLALMGLISVAWPLRRLGILNRIVAAAVLAAGVLVALVGVSRPAPDLRATGPQTRLDEFAPVYQFYEAHSIPAHASAARVYRAIGLVTAEEVPFYRTLVWLRRGGVDGPESILSPAAGVPLITVATRTSFLKLGEVPNREIVIGTVVIAPAGVRLATGPTPESFKALTRPGFAKAVMSFLITERGPNDCLLSTETRVFATDDVSRARFARYWRIIAPASAALRVMWLRAIKIRAEAST